MEAQQIAIIGVRTRHDGPHNDACVLWLCKHVAGAPRPEGRENDNASFFTLAEIEARDDVTELACYLARRVLTGAVPPAHRSRLHLPDARHETHVREAVHVKPGAGRRTVDVVLAPVD